VGINPPTSEFVDMLNPFYSKTKESSKWWTNPILKDKIRFYFLEYLESTKDKLIILRETKTNSGVYVPYTTRFDGNYANIVKWALWNVYIDYGVMFTLTADPKRYKNILGATTRLRPAGIE